MGRGLFRYIVVLGAVAGLVAFAVGCGSGSTSSPGGSTDTTASGGSSAPTELVASNGTSAEFLKPGSSTNQLVKLGHEAPRSELEAAATVLATSLEAREKADFSVQCMTFSQTLIEELAAPKKGAAAKKACPAAVENLAKPLSKTKSVRVDTLNDGGEVAVLQVKGDEGNALYHGNDKKDYSAPMKKEQDGEWKVSALLTIELNPPERTPSSPPAETKPGG